MEESPKPKKTPEEQAAEKALIEKNFAFNSETLLSWSAACAEIAKKEKELLKLRRVRDALEEEWPFLTNVKGILKKPQKKKDREGKEEKKPSEPKRRKLETPTGEFSPKKIATPAQENIEKRLEENREKISQALEKTTLTRKDLENLEMKDADRGF